MNSCRFFGSGARFTSRPETPLTVSWALFESRKRPKWRSSPPRPAKSDPPRGAERPQELKTRESQWPRSTPKINPIVETTRLSVRRQCQSMGSCFGLSESMTRRRTRKVLGQKARAPERLVGRLTAQRQGGRHPALPRAGRFQDRHRQAHGRVPYDPLQLHEDPRAQAEPLACISARIWSVPLTTLQARGGLRKQKCSGLYNPGMSRISRLQSRGARQ